MEFKSIKEKEFFELQKYILNSLEWFYKNNHLDAKTKLMCTLIFLHSLSILNTNIHKEDPNFWKRPREMILK